MRVISSDTEDRQTQRAGDGFEYVFRKDFLHKGTSEEYSLVLLYSRKPKDEKPEEKSG
jgi:hypothetical protein